ncbi:MAG: hypothetical protein ACRCZS_01705 [Chroococcidiopsis sp.]
MTNVEQDKGYCINITPTTVDVLTFNPNDLVFNHIKGKVELIKSLVNFENLSSSDLLLDAATNQFSDKSIDVFVDESSLTKGYPLVAKTRQGMPLHGNLVVLAHDGDSNTTLLTKEQADLAIKELRFTQKMLRQDVDLSKYASPYNNNSNYPEQIQQLISILISFCVNEDKQIMLKALSPERGEDIAALVICLQNDKEVIDRLYADITKLLKSRKYK